MATYSWFTGRISYSSWLNIHGQETEQTEEEIW